MPLVFDLDKFLAKVAFSDYCWDWIGPKDKDGYGVANVYIEKKRTTRRAHNVLTQGLVNGLHADHICRNKGCVRPSHIRYVTLAKNNELKPMKSHCKNGHSYPENYTKYRTCAECSRLRVRRENGRIQVIS